MKNEAFRAGIILVIVSVLVACARVGSSVTPAGIALKRPAAVALGHPNTVVTIYVGQATEAVPCCSIFAFQGSNTPTSHITGLNFPGPLVANANGVYIVQAVSGSNPDQYIAQFALNANGNAEPLSTLFCRCKFNGDGGLAIDGSGNIWLGGDDDTAGGAPTIYKFAPKAQGTPAPLRKITSGLSGLTNNLAGIALDASGNLYVGILGVGSPAGEILRYDRGSDSVTTTIKGANTTLQSPAALSSYADSTGRDQIITADNGARKIDIWSAVDITNCNCSIYNKGPVHVIGPNSSLPVGGYAPLDAAPDSSGNIYATSSMA